MGSSRNLKVCDVGSVGYHENLFAWLGLFAVSAGLVFLLLRREAFP